MPICRYNHLFVLGTGSISFRLNGFIVRDNGLCLQSSIYEAKRQR